MRTLLDKDGVLLDASTIRFERLLPGPIERIWAYLTESEKRKLWIAAGDFELHKGGKTQMSFHHKNISKKNSTVPGAGTAGLSESDVQFMKKVHEEGHSFSGEVLAVEVPRLLTMTWGDHSEVTFELTEQANGEVLLTLTHRKLTASDLKNVSPGWHAHLAILADRLNDREPGDFWAIWLEARKHYAEKFA